MLLGCGGRSGGRTEHELREVEDLVHRRGVAKSRGDYAQAAALTEALYDLGVDLDDRRRLWRFA